MGTDNEIRQMYVAFFVEYRGAFEMACRINMEYSFNHKCANIVDPFGLTVISENV